MPTRPGVVWIDKKGSVPGTSRVYQRTPRAVSGILAGVLRASLVAMSAVGLVACETIDLGPDTQPPSGCTARPDFFVSDVWPRFFEKTDLPFTKYLIDDWRGARANLNASTHIRF